MSMVSPIPTHDEMESLFVNNVTLDRIGTYLGRFNPIRVMKMERMEIRHSAILAWLLDPKETHGLADNFLKTFLAEALRGYSSLGYPTALDISQADMRDAEIRCEWRNIDIYVLDRRNNLAFIIENKFDSRQYVGQLEGYANKVKTAHEEHDEELTVRGVFLTLHDEEPEDQSFATIKYEAICEFFPRFIEQEAHLLTSEVEVFLKHYLEILKDAAGMSTEQTDMEQLARQLYRDHKKVLDFVIEHGVSSDFVIAAQSLFGENTEELDLIQVGKNHYRLGGMRNDWISFVPESWYAAFGEDQYDWQGCEDWWAGYPLIAWVHLRADEDGTKGRLTLHAEVGPIKDHSFRKSLIESIETVATEMKTKRIRFQRGAADEGKKYSKFLKENWLEVKDIQDAEELANMMQKLLTKFQPEFEAVSSILPQYQKYGV